MHTSILSPKHFFILLTISVFCWHCQPKTYPPDQLPARQLLFGDGGGFTGAVTTYTLLENGQLFRHTSLENSTVELGTMPPEDAKALFAKATELQLAQLNIDRPGNVYYFITLKNGDSEAKCTWGDPNFAVDARVENLYQTLTAAVQKTPAPTK